MILFRMLGVVIALLGLPSAASWACMPLPPMGIPPRSDEASRELAAIFIARSDAIVDGVIVKGRDTARAKRDPRKYRTDFISVLKAGRVLKGSVQDRYFLDETTPMCGGLDLYRLKTGTKVRLLLQRLGAVHGITLWSFQDSTDNSNAVNEARMNAAIDKLVGSRRDPQSALFAYPEPTPPPKWER